MVMNMLRYIEVKQELKSRINRLNNGDQLPSRMKLCRLLDTSRATVDKAIKELEKEGYLESHIGSGTYVARRLEGVNSEVMNWCLIVPDITENIYGRMAGSIERAAREWNVNIILCNSENSSEKQSEYIKRLIMAGVDGFIIVPVVMKTVVEGIGLYQSLVQSKIPFVFCNRDVEGVYAPIIKSNDFYGGYIATLHLLDHGYRNIVFLALKRYRTSIERCQGYISAIQHRNQEIVRKRILMLDNDNIEDCHDSLLSLLKSEIPVDAVFCFNDDIAFQAIRAVEDAGLRVSDDVGIMGYGDNESLLDMEIPLTTITHKTEDVGKLAARVFRKKMEKKEDEIFEYYLIEPEIVVRKSCLGKT